MQSRNFIAVAALTLMLAGCGAEQPAPTRTAMTSPAPTAPKAVASPEGQPWSGKVPWLSTLPDPAKTDRTNAMTVARDYTVTKHSWDSTIDRTEDYALKRAGIYGSETLKQSLQPMDPDQAKGQALIANEKPFGTWTSTSITFCGREGKADKPGTDIVTLNWRMELHRRKGGRESPITGTDDVKLIRDTTGSWHVDGSITREPEA